MRKERRKHHRQCRIIFVAATVSVGLVAGLGAQEEAAERAVVLRGDRVDLQPHLRPAEPKAKGGGDFILWGDLTVRGVKSTATVDPTDSKRAIYFATLEGPEVGTYYRGSGKLEGGEAVIELPASFVKLTETHGLTVQLTPIGAWSRLYVAEKSRERLVVRQAEGDDAVAFDFLVQGVRAGHADFEVERGSGDTLVFPESAGGS